MSVSRPAGCLLKGPARLRPSALTHSFHTSSTASARYRPKYPSIKAEDMGLVKPVAKRLVGYSKVEKDRLSEIYTPEQLRAIEAGEEAVDPKDIVKQGQIRRDPAGLQYLDDLSTIRPTVDKRVSHPRGNVDPNARWKSDKELAWDIGKFILGVPEGQSMSEYLETNSDDASLKAVADRSIENMPDRIDYEKYLDNLHLTTDPNEKKQHSSLAPAIPPYRDPHVTYHQKSIEGEIDPEQRRLMAQTGFSSNYLGTITAKSLVKRWVTNQTRLGKVHSWSVLSIAGDKNGMLGMGQGKSVEFEDAMRMAKSQAIRAMKPIHRYEDRTIYGVVEGKVGAVELKLEARPPGFGLRCQHLIFEICRIAGISDIAARSTRARNPMNTVKATIEALYKQRLPEDIAKARGKKLVDVRKVYYSGQTYNLGNAHLIGGREESPREGMRR